jgi:hypothetical protein
MSAPVPHFIIGGAPRSGTTFLCHALDQHPDVYMAKPYVPEPKVFIGPARPQPWYYDRYAQMFADTKGRTVRGEKTTLYFESAEAPGRIREALPNVRILFLVREPVGRAYSNYLWSTKNGLETLPFERAIELEGTRTSPLPPEKSYARPFDYLCRGDYATFAQNYYNAFGRERVGFFLYEDIERQPEVLLAAVQRFIGVKPHSIDARALGLINSAREVGPPLNSDTERRLRERMRSYVERFTALTGLAVAPWGY